MANMSLFVTTLYSSYTLLMRLSTQYVQLNVIMSVERRSLLDLDLVQKTADEAQEVSSDDRVPKSAAYDP